MFAMSLRVLLISTAAASAFVAAHDILPLAAAFAIVAVLVALLLEVSE